MRWGSKSAISTIIAVVLWTAAPLLVCVPFLRASADPDCCATMAMPDCGTDSMVSGSCCNLAPTPSKPAGGSTYMIPHTQHAGALVPVTYLRLTADPDGGNPGFREAAPPHPSPGGSSVLRI